MIKKTDIHRFGYSALLLIVLCGLSCWCSTLPTQTIKIKIEAPLLDQGELLKKLNDHGSSHNWKFEAVDSDYDYRIVFGTKQEKSDALIWGSGGSMNTSAAGAAVFDASGTELFRFTRGERWTDTGATNAVAKEIIKRLAKIRTKTTK